MSQEEVQKIKKTALEALKKARSSKQLEDIKVEYLGKRGHLSLMMKKMGKLSQDERPAFGQLVNSSKQEIENLHSELETSFAHSELEEQMKQEKVDMTLPGSSVFLGSRHPVNLVINEVVRIMERLGYSVQSGPLIESDWYNFEALNIAKDHPSRDMQDTFYIDSNHVFKNTHKSCSNSCYGVLRPTIACDGAWSCFSL